MNNDFCLRLGLFGLCVGVLVGLVLWLVWRKNHKAERDLGRPTSHGPWRMSTARS